MAHDTCYSANLLLLQKHILSLHTREQSQGLFCITRECLHWFLSMEHILPLLDCLQKYMKNLPKKIQYTNGLPDDEHIIFKTCRRHEELN